ncbi:MAG: acylphosphatase [Ignavibacteriales bacterium]|nr:acylphosphatase [Ignavibacteriales bacterium]
MRKAKIIVKGFVQGVGYRYFCYKKASEYELTGYAKNLFNGEVEVEVEGEEYLILGFIKELKIGPMRSNVKMVDYVFENYENKYDEFKMY